MKAFAINPNPDRKLFQISHAIIRHQHFVTAPGWLHALLLRLINNPVWSDHYAIHMVLRLARIEQDFTNRFGHIVALFPGDIITVDDQSTWKVISVDVKGWVVEVRNISTHIVLPDTERWRLRLFARTAQSVPKAA